jgi:hypothetical protein
MDHGAAYAEESVAAAIRSQHPRNPSRDDMIVASPYSGSFPQTGAQAMRGLFLVSAVMLFAASSALAQGFTDPVPYCQAVDTIDSPDARYTGPKLPDWMAAKLQLEPGQPKFMEWRCAQGVVLACLYGANIPCNAKAVTSREPTAGIIQYCQENPGSDFVPMFVAGHETVVSWACQGAEPVVTRVEPVDAEGYAKAYWHPVSP